MPIVLDQPDPDYRAAVGVNSSSLASALRSAGHYRYQKDHPRPPSDAMSFGSLCHLHILQPHLLEAEVVVMPEDAPTKRSNAGKEWHARFAEDNANKLVVTQEDFDCALTIAATIAAHPIASELLADCTRREVSLYWTEIVTGLPCKARLDGLSDDNRVIVDLKSSADAREQAFARSAWDYGYHLQAAHYTDAVLSVLNIQPLFCWIVFESEPPHAVQVYSAAPQLMHIGDEDRGRALRVIDAATRSGAWPLYPEIIKPLNLPGWAIRARTPEF